MRVLLIADVHANREALLALQCAEPQPDAVLFAGDAVGYGPDPLYCVRWLLAHARLAVRGNHDQAIARSEFAGFPAELDDAAHETLDYACDVLPEHDQAQIVQWPTSASIMLGNVRFYVTHGTPVDPLGGLLNPATCSAADLHAWFDGVAADVIVLGHTHVPAIRKFDGKVIVNPGSLGQPRYGTPDATYAVWEDGRMQIKHLHYDHAATARKLRLTPLSPEVTDQLSEILASGLVR